MRALVLGGAGAVCKETTRDLAEFSDFEKIDVGDYNLEAAEALIDSIGDSRLSAVRVDANDEAALAGLFPQYDIVVNGLPFKYDYVVNKTCVETGVNGLDVSSEDAQFALHRQAAQKGMLFVPGVGATPGVTNAMAAKGVAMLDELHRVQIYFAAFRCLAPAPGLLTTTIWEFDPEAEERQEAYYEDGRWRPAPPLSHQKIVRFHDLIGEQPVYTVPHDEAYSMPVSWPGVRHVSVRGCFPPHVMRLMKALKEAGALDKQPLDALGGRSPLDLTRELLLALPSSLENPVWAYGLVVEVEGKKDGQAVRHTFRNSHPPQEEWGGSSAYFKNVGIPLSIGAQLIAHGRVKQGAVGVMPPELVFDSDAFFEELARRGIETHHEANVL